MKAINERVRCIMMYELKKKSNSTVAVKCMYQMHGGNIIYISQCQRWFNKFRSRNYSFKKHLRVRRNMELDEIILQTTVTIRELTQKLNLIRFIIQIIVISIKLGILQYGL